MNDATPRLLRHRLLGVLIGLLLVMAGMQAASAQGLIDYGSLIGGDASEETEAPAPLSSSRPPLPIPGLVGTGTPLQSTATTTPVAAPSYGSIASSSAITLPSSEPLATTPSAEDYARVADVVMDPSIDRTQQAVRLFRERLRSTVRRLPEALRSIETTLAAASPTGKPVFFIGVALFAALLLAIARAMTLMFVVYIARRIFFGIQRPNPQGYLGKLPVLAVRFAITAVAIAMTIAFASALGLFFYQDDRAVLTTVLTVFGGYATLMLADTVWRMVFAPYLSEHRLPRIDDLQARSLYAGMSGASTFTIISMGFVTWMHELGLAGEVYVAMTVILSLTAIIGHLIVLRINRKAITQMILAGRVRAESSLLSFAASKIWAPVLLIYLVSAWATMSFRLVMGVNADPARMIAPYVILLSGLLLYAAASYMIERIFSRGRRMAAINRELDDNRALEEAAERDRIRDASDKIMADADGDDEGGGAVDMRASETTMAGAGRPGLRTFEDLARRVASLFAIGAVTYALARFWLGHDAFERLPGLDLVQNIIDIVFLGYIGYHAARIWMDRKIAEEGGDDAATGPGEGEGGGAGATRLATLLPLFRNFVLILIVTAVTLVIATEVGVNVAPLFAGAGIVGLAIGFGAQTLVRDILSGAFFLADDAFRKGEYIDVGEVKGTVEKISLRSFQLRHHLGMLHTIPFGEITHLTNFSRDWVIMKLPLRLTYDTDVEKVRKLIKKLGQGLLEDPEIGHKFIQPVKSQGVIMMDDSAMIVRIKFMTHPGEQWVLRKRIYAEIRELFESEGIKFAHREVTVRVPGLDDKSDKLSDEQIKAIGAGARRAVDQADEDNLQPVGAGGMGDMR